MATAPGGSRGWRRRRRPPRARGSPPASRPRRRGRAGPRRPRAGSRGGSDRSGSRAPSRRPPRPGGAGERSRSQAAASAVQSGASWGWTPAVAESRGLRRGQRQRALGGGRRLADDDDMPDARGPGARAAPRRGRRRSRHRRGGSGCRRASGRPAALSAWPAALLRRRGPGGLDARARGRGRASGQRVSIAIRTDGAMYIDEKMPVNTPKNITSANGRMTSPPKIASVAMQ